MKKLTLFIVVVALIAGGYYWYRVRNARPDPTVLTQSLSRGDVVDTVGATGTLEAVETVEIGTQVSGVVPELRALLNYRKALVNFETVQTVGTRAIGAVGGGGGL